MDGLMIWKSILNTYKDNINPSFYNTFFGNNATIFYEFYDNTIFLKCINEFIRENLSKELNKIHDIARNQLNLGDITVKLILNDNEVQKIVKEIYHRENKYTKYTFDAFVTGTSNNLAYAACIAVAENPAFESPKDAYNPLFLYGGVGLGKTHLMHAISNRIKEKNPNYKVSYISSETFTNDFIYSLQNRKTQDFRDKYRELDAILIDDVQFFADKDTTQEELFHTFNELYSANKQIILSSDRPPKELTTLEDRLRSRFGMGLTIDIQPPDFETRVAILEKKCETDRKEVPRDVLNLIAKNIKANIRELEGALNKVCGYSNLMKRPISFELANEVLNDLFDKNSDRQLSSDYIKEVVAREFNIKYDDFSSKKKTKNIAYPRQIAMYLCKEMMDMSLSKIGEEFGNRDHTTVIHACKKVEEDIQSKKENMDMIVEKLMKKIKGE